MHPTYVTVKSFAQTCCEQTTLTSWTWPQNNSQHALRLSPNKVCLLVSKKTSSIFGNQIKKKQSVHWFFKQVSCHSVGDCRFGADFPKCRFANWVAIRAKVVTITFDLWTHSKNGGLLLLSADDLYVFAIYNRYQWCRHNWVPPDVVSQKQSLSQIQQVLGSSLLKCWTRIVHRAMAILA